MTEMNIEVDEHDNQIGIRPREDFYTGKYIHRASHLILLNTNGEILIQHRSPTKRWYPNLFTFSVSGTVGEESYEECIKKEMKEELGISIYTKKLFTYSSFDEHDKAWHCVFVGEIGDSSIQTDEEEIQGIKRIKKETLKNEIQNNPNSFTPAFIKGINIFFLNYGDEL